MNQLAETTETIETTTTETTTEVKGKRGRTRNPNSASSLAPQILDELAKTTTITRKIAVQKLMDELKIKESSANTFYYTWHSTHTSK